MLENALITIFGADAEENTVIRYRGKACMLQYTKLVPEGKGFVCRNTYRVRISGNTDYGFKTGDFLCKGIFEKPPERKKRFKIMGISDNLRGGIAHWRLDCV